MADWTELDTNGLLPGEPFTSAKALAFFENPVAMAEGKVNAPKVVSEALNMLVGAGTSTGTFTDLERIDEVLVNAFAYAIAGSGGTPAGAMTVRYETSSNNGSSWASPVTITTADSADALDTNSASVVVSLGSSNNAIRISGVESGTSGRITKFSFSILGVSGVSP